MPLRQPYVFRGTVVNLARSRYHGAMNSTHIGTPVFDFYCEVPELVKVRYSATLLALTAVLKPVPAECNALSDDGAEPLAR